MRPTLICSKAVPLALALAIVPLAGCPAQESEDLEHGIINIEFKRGQSETASPYIGTTQVQVTLLYLECLVNFYNVEPDYQQLSPEGALVFGSREEGGEGWFDRLCDEEQSGQANCTVERFTQELDVATQLTVLYNVEGDIEDLTLPFGPIPKPSLANCEAGGQPILRVGGMGSVTGQDTSGTRLWNTETFSPEQATTGQGQAIKIRAARLNGG